MTRTTVSKADQETARDVLRQLLPVGTTVYTVLKHVSRSGMSRRIDCFVMQDNVPRWISGYVKCALGMTQGKTDDVRVDGCGMDMGFHVVETLSRVLYPNGFECIGDSATRSASCPSNDHSNGDRDYTPHHHKSGGYALRHRWI